LNAPVEKVDAGFLDLGFDSASHLQTNQGAPEISMVNERAGNPSTLIFDLNIVLDLV
jgi:hypothetical protein